MFNNTLLSMKVMLFTPGPAEVPKRILEVLSKPIIHHRSQDFRDIFFEVRENLKKLFLTKQDVLILASTGTGAMEAAVSNIFSKGDRVLVVNGGKFGERWTKICSAFGLEVKEIKIQWGKAVSVEQVETELKKDGNFKGLFVQACETSTGVENPVKELSSAVRKIAGDDIIIVVDGITAIGVFEVNQDGWDLDVVIGGSQKALMLPPGLSMLSVSERARRMAEKSNLPKFYFDLKRERKAQEGGETAFTPAIGLVVALRESLRMIFEEGLDNVFERHRRLAVSTRRGCSSLGLKIFPERPANGLTTVEPPCDAEKLRKRMRELGAWVAGGQDSLKGRVIRIAHMGYYFDSDVIYVMGILERALCDMGVKINVGDGLKASLESLRS